jgi:hypothetical protein
MLPVGADEVNAAQPLIQEPVQMMKTMSTALAGGALALALMMGLTTPHSDAAERGQGKGRGAMAACRTDVATFCQGVEAGRGARLTCLASHKDKLQPDCATAVEARLAARAARRAGAPAEQTAASAPDATKSDQAPASPNQAEAPAADQARGQDDARGRQRMRGARMGLGGREDGRGEGARGRARGACRTDAQSLCADARGPERRQCLMTNVDKVSPECAAALKGPKG